MGELTSKTALVTGSVQGIARALGAAGARIGIPGLATPEEAEAACAAVRADGAPEAVFFDADMRDPAAIERMMAAVDA